MKQTSFLGSPAKRAEFIFGQPMNPCPKCGSYNMAYRTPIKHTEPLPDELTPEKLLGIYARACKEGNTPLEGIAYMACQDCAHRGPSVNVSGRTSEDVGRDPAVAKEIKRLWNEQDCRNKAVNSN